jgi:hypothetical protein
VRDPHPPVSGTILFCGPPGTRKATAAFRIKDKLAELDFQADVFDIDGELPDIVEGLRQKEGWKTYLKDVFLGQQRPFHVIISNLPRDVISRFWREAAKAVLAKISGSKAPVKIVLAHLVYYRWQTDEFYIPATPSLLKKLLPPDKPRALVTFIDDVFDMYFRLSQIDQVFGIEQQVDMALHRNSLGEPPTDPAKRKEYNASCCVLAFSVVVRTLLRLLSWRENEVLAAENVASWLEAQPPVLLAAKHPVEVGAWAVLKRLGFYDAPLVYLSHPISHVRKQQKSTGQWPEFVDEYHDFVRALLQLRDDHGRPVVVPFMPTAIDELRISTDIDELRNSTDSKAPQHPRHPTRPLTSRWPLLFPAEQLLYELGQGCATYEDLEDKIRAEIFDPPALKPTNGANEWRRFSEVFRELEKEGEREGEGEEEKEEGKEKETDLQMKVRGRVAGLLEALSHHVQRQLANRDHYLVRQCEVVMAYRPCAFEGRLSSGVNDEIQNFRRIAAAPSAVRVETGGRQLILFHTRGDLKKIKKEVPKTKRLDLLAWLAEALRPYVGNDAVKVLELKVDFRAQDWLLRVLAALSPQGLSGGSIPPGAISEDQRKEILAGFSREIKRRFDEAVKGGAGDVGAKILVLPAGWENSSAREEFWKSGLRDKLKGLLPKPKGPRGGTLSR